jgi:hypothetical protein
MSKDTRLSGPAYGMRESSYERGGTVTRVQLNKPDAYGMASPCCMPEEMPPDSTADRDGAAYRKRL